jgi:two-component system response regulator YesN
MISKIMIVEDNASTREGLCENVPWYENNIEVIAALPNGREAIEYLNGHLPDVVITDIVMPIMDGLELTHAIKRDYPDIKVIVLSAYDEFKYAQEAIKIGVFDYVIKPFDYGYLLDTVKRALDEKRQDAALKEQVKKSIPVLREKFFLQLVEEDREDLAFMDDTKYLGLKFDNKQYICVLYEIDNIKQVKRKINIEKYNILLLKITDIILSNFSDVDIWIFRTRSSCLASILGLNDENTFRIDNLLYERLESIRKQIEKKFDVTLSIGVGNIVPHICKVSDSYRKARDVLEYKFLMGNNRIFNSKDTAFTGKTEHAYFPLSIEENLIKKACIGNMNGALECINKLIEYFKSNTVNKGYAKTIVYGLISKMYQKLYESGIKIDNIFMSREKVFKQIQDFDESKQMLTWLKEIVIDICKEVGYSMFQYHKHIIQQVKDFINKTYMKEDCKLNEIARQVGISPTYLSALFKKETAVNISEYILKVRMEKAQELLLFSDLRISDISYRVGYSNQFYFSTCFKKYTGRTPNEFRSKRD